jgi:hypothetical protein
VPRTSLAWNRWVGAFAAFIAASAYYGLLGLTTGFLAFPQELTDRLPFHSPVFAGVALAFVVGLPCTWAAVLAVRGHPRTPDAVTLAGFALVGWIAVETVVIRQFSPLQVVYGSAGLGLLVLGSRESLRQLGEVLGAVPLFLLSPLLRPWHLRWGASAQERTASMAGDDLVPVSHFTATRAVTINAPPDAVWPWLLQVGFRRAGFYSYDLLDNLGRRSADDVLWQWQHLQVGDVVAPMTNPYTSATSFVLAECTPFTTLLWAKPDSTWTWSLRPLPGGQTRLVTRIRQRYDWRPAAWVTVVLAELGDFAMMRKMLLGIKQRAERSSLRG